jgi:hypothetical protein
MDHPQIKWLQSPLSSSGDHWAQDALETELQDTKARTDKLQEDLDELRTCPMTTGGR